MLTTTGAEIFQALRPSRRQNYCSSSTHSQGTSPWEIAGSLSKQPSLVCGHGAAACTRHPAAAPRWLSSQLQNYCRCASSPKPPHHAQLRGTDPKPPLSREINTSCKILALNYQLLTASLTLQQNSFGKKKIIPLSKLGWKHPAKQF